MLGISRMLEMKLPGERKRGRPRKRVMDVETDDMQGIGVTEEDGEDRKR